MNGCHVLGSGIYTPAGVGIQVTGTDVNVHNNFVKILEASATAGSFCAMSITASNQLSVIGNTVNVAIKSTSGICGMLIKDALGGDSIRQRNRSSRNGGRRGRNVLWNEFCKYTATFNYRPTRLGPFHAGPAGPTFTPTSMQIQPRIGFLATRSPGTMDSMGAPRRRSRSRISGSAIT